MPTRPTRWLHHRPHRHPRPPGPLRGRRPDPPEPGAPAAAHCLVRACDGPVAQLVRERWTLDTTSLRRRTEPPVTPGGMLIVPECETYRSSLRKEQAAERKGTFFRDDFHPGMESEQAAAPLQGKSGYCATAASENSAARPGTWPLGSVDGRADVRRRCRRRRSTGAMFRSRSIPATPVARLKPGRWGESRRRGRMPH